MRHIENKYEYYYNNNDSNKNLINNKIKVDPFLKKYKNNTKTSNSKIKK